MMIALYLDYLLNDEELYAVQRAVGEPVSPVRIPWLLPLPSSPGPLRCEPEAVRPHLRKLQIQRLRGERILLVAPRDSRWYVSLAEAIRGETGQYPLLVQPAARRAAVGCPGPLRIVDMNAYMQGENAEDPPWSRPRAPGADA